MHYVRTRAHDRCGEMNVVRRTDKGEKSDQEKGRIGEKYRTKNVQKVVCSYSVRTNANGQETEERCVKKRMKIVC